MITQISGKPPEISVVRESANRIVGAYAAVVARNSQLPYQKGMYEVLMAKSELAREALAIFTSDMDGDKVIESMSMSDVCRAATAALKAADYVDPAGAVGTLSGTLVLQKSLPLMMFDFPILGSIFSDFSDEPGLFNQTQTTRIVTTPAVEEYDTTLGSDGRPNGWDLASLPQTVDVSVKLDSYVGVPIVFGQSSIGATLRNMFEENVPKATYALGKYLVAKLTALFTPANYNAYAGNSATGGATTEGSENITVTSTAAMYPGQAISGVGLPSNTFVASIQSSTAATLTQEATASNAGLTFTLNGAGVPNPLTAGAAAGTYVQAANAFTFQDLGQISALFDQNEVPFQQRSILLNSAFYSRLTADPTLAASIFAAITNPGIITDRQLPRLQSILPFNAPWLPSTNNLTGFAYHRAAAVLKTRLPGDFTRALGRDVPIPGSTTVVTAPGGFSVLNVQYVDLKRGYAEARPEVMVGAAVGDRRGGLCLCSQ